ncbi:Octopamine receptor beta-2R [Holothuria leucospilota]|uniref:Octopamine receptor beta-2R n=1 Tax=Holothuria leucospilota TaxID=206669 RepID=A0A9Q1CE44_HOLLE|nr:Octopamine receptor beta-2R [Holothuria leucospilota]
MEESLFSNSTENYSPEEELPTRPVAVSIFFVIIAVLGISGNGLVLVVIAKVPDLRSITNILIGHQSFVDFISSCLLLVVYFPQAINLEALSANHIVLANFICKVWVDQFVYWAVIKVSTVNLVCLTLERYFAVVYPHNYRQRASKKGAALVCVAAWIIGPLSELYFLFTFSVDEGGQCSKNELKRSGEYAIAFMVFTFTLVIPLMIMAFVYISIIRALRPVKPVANVASNAQVNKSNSSLHNGDNQQQVANVSASVTFQESNGNQRVENDNQQVQFKGTVRTVRERARRNVLTTMFLVSLTYAVCWTPNQIIYFYYNLVSQTDFTGSFYLFTVILAGTNVCVNPIIYAFKYRKFQQGLRQVFLKQAPVIWETTATDPS